MGRIKHSAAIITSTNLDKLITDHNKAKQIYKRQFSKNAFVVDPQKIVSDIIPGITNGQYSFFIAPDGSKEGWNDSNLSDDARKELFDFIDDNLKHLNYIEIDFGGDDDISSITRTDVY